MRIKLLAMAVPPTLACVLLSGCSLLRPVSETADTMDLTPVTRLLFYSRALVRASPSGRLAILKAAQTAYANHPTAATAARLALAYGQPGQKGYAPENGWRYARKALALGKAHWGPAATAYLQQFAALCADNAQVRDQLERLRENNERIKRQLAKARQKLHALTRIELKLKP